MAKTPAKLKLLIKCTGKFKFERNIVSRLNIWMNINTTIYWNEILMLVNVKSKDHKRLYFMSLQWYIQCYTKDCYFTKK